MKKYYFILSLLCSITSCAQNQRDFILYESERLSSVKKNLRSGSATQCEELAFEKLIANAQNLLEIKNPTVMEKTIDPPTGNKHDYLSISRYWWPDPQKEDGLPWIRKDGVTNPETQTDAVDRNRLGLMTSSVKNLSLAYYFTEEERYAKKAISMLDTWFLQETTRMNPHLKYAQSVPGNPKGRRSGILDGRLIALTVPDAIVILRNSPDWTTSLEKGMMDWFTQYLNWLTESDLGMQGAKQQNNHGSWYRIHVAAIALFVDQQSVAEEMIQQAMLSLEEQLDEEGRQIHEIKRTRSFFYSCFNLEPLIMLAQIGERLAIDFWEYESPTGKSLSLAFKYLTPVVDGNDWPHPSQEDNKMVHLVPILHRFNSQKNEVNQRKTLGKALIQLKASDLREAEKSYLFEECLLSGFDWKLN